MIDQWVICGESENGYLYPITISYSSYEEAEKALDDLIAKIKPAWDNYRLDGKELPKYNICNLYDWVTLAKHKKEDYSFNRVKHREHYNKSTCSSVG